MQTARFPVVISTERSEWRNLLRSRLLIAERSLDSLRSLGMTREEGGWFDCRVEVSSTGDLRSKSQLPAGNLFGRWAEIDLIRQMPPTAMAFATVRLRCPILSLARTPASMIDRGTLSTPAASATGSAGALRPQRGRVGRVMPRPYGMTRGVGGEE